MRVAGVFVIFCLVCCCLCDSERYLVSLKLTETLDNFLKYDNSYPLSQHINPLIEKAFKIGKFNGFTGSFSEQAIERLRRCPLVAEITPDIPVVAFEEYQLQENSPRHLARLSQKNKLDESQDYFEYCFKESGPVRAYVVDSGININHPEFEGRAVIGIDLTGEGPGDFNGHGTHVAGLIGSKTYGSSKNVTLVEVKALDKTGAGSLSSIIAALEFAVDDRDEHNVPGVVNLSLGSIKNYALNRAVNAATGTGLVVVVAAGNSNMNACLSSPASASQALTVGAIDDTDDSLAVFTNWGDCVKMFASGVNVESVHYEDEESSHKLSGTSMSAPIVSGFVATLLSLGKSPYNMKQIVSKMSLKKRIPRLSISYRFLTPNKIVYNGSAGKCSALE